MISDDHEKHTNAKEAVEVLPYTAGSDGTNNFDTLFFHELNKDTSSMAFKGKIYIDVILYTCIIMLLFM